jgi:hypothetical protein
MAFILTIILREIEFSVRRKRSSLHQSRRLKGEEYFIDRSHQTQYLDLLG